ncbi:hypothetical protein EDD11_007534 [Mortierella claussenii]|nr:hypothetical protein EDD11_007534 [Mortierella claussenii]
MGNILTKCCTVDERRRKKKNTAPTTSHSSSSPPEYDIQLNPISGLHCQQQPQNAPASATSLSCSQQSASLDDTVASNTASLADRRFDNNSSAVNATTVIVGKNNKIKNHQAGIANSKASAASFFKQLSSSFQNLTRSKSNSSIHNLSSKSYNTTPSTIHRGQGGASALESPQSLSSEQGFGHRLPFTLTAEERKVLLSNEIPASEIEKLSIGVDAGGMGIIHVAEWKGIKVAIKEASAHVISKEVEIYNRMQGFEGVVQYYGVTYPPGLDKLCIVTKYAENGSLSWYLKVGFHKLTWADKLMLATQISSSIARLHQQGIFHRDLHGGNILIDEAGNAMLTDFGASTMEERVARGKEEYAIEALTTSEGHSKFVSQLAPTMGGLAPTGAHEEPSAMTAVTIDTNKLGEEVQDDKQHDPLIGVMAYIAPERFRNPRYFDARCDIYSLGVLLWELTSGHSAFSKLPQDVQLAVSILNGKREEAMEGTPVMYQALYERCWDTEPEMRPSLDEILSTLAKVRAELTEEQLAVTRERSAARHGNGETDFEDSVSVPRPTSDYQKYLIVEE